MSAKLRSQELAAPEGEGPPVRAEGMDAWAREELNALSARGLLRHLEPLSTPQGPLIQVGSETLLNFSSNDYLGLARDPRLAAAAAAATARYGSGAGASRLIVGDSTAHQALEAKLASFVGAPAALLFNSGYAANVGVLSSLMGQGDLIFSDALNHASLIDGCRLSRARKVVYPHGDLKGLELLLNALPGRRRLVVTESVFSMDGDLAPLADLVTLCRKHGCALMVDEAHALGVHGPSGKGLGAELGLEEEIDLRVGTFGKALGGFGAFVATSHAARELLFNKARSLVFSTSLPAPVCAAAQEAVEIVEAEPELRERLWANIRRFAAGLNALGLPAEPRSAIFPVVLGEPDAAVAAAHALRARGILAKPIRPPTVPEGTSRLRFAVCAAHTPGQLDLALDALRAHLHRT